jgi:hypothetical protein
MQLGVKRYICKVFTLKHVVYVHYNVSSSSFGPQTLCGAKSVFWTCFEAY